MDKAISHSFGATGDDAGLLARMRKADDAALAECVRAYYSRLLVVARRILGNEEDSRDAVQDAFLAAVRNIENFEGRSQLGTWLHRIVINAALGRLRKRQRHPERSIESFLPHFGDDEHQIDPPAPWRDVGGGLQQQESRELIRQSIDKLPEIYRTVLVLRDIEELDTDETACLLETTPQVVKTRLHRARQALRTLLDPYFRESES
jgi:RNA polymerase sigma-70 factor (ECF subfamily)